MKQTNAEVGALHPNSWNPNKMNDRTFEAERESIGKFGFIDPITVRPHPELDGQFQIIDGEHRWRAAQDIGIKKVPVCVIDVSDVEAKKLTIVLNETRGQADTVDLAALLAEIKVDDPDLLLALPYTQEQLDNLVAMADLEGWEKELEGASMPTGGSTAGEDDWTTIECRVPNDFAHVWDEVRGAIVEEVAEADGSLSAEITVAHGQILEILCADYLAGRQRTARATV